MDDGYRVTLRPFRADEDAEVHLLLTGNAWVVYSGREVTRLRPDDDVDCAVPSRHEHGEIAAGVDDGGAGGQGGPGRRPDAPGA